MKGLANNLTQIQFLLSLKPLQPFHYLTIANMPKIVATVDFLADLPLYDTEKPYFYLPGKDQEIDPEDPRLNNLEFESHTVEVEDMREHPELTLSTCGFTFINNTSSNLQFQTPSDVDAYKRETEELLTSHFSAVKVLTYEVRLRKNQRFERRQFDLNDKLLQEGPAKGAHNDVTYTSGPNIIQRYLPVEDQKAFLRAGYRVRIFNTWRPLVDVLEDRPLALCDSSSVVPDDLIAADRILPDRVGEIYYLRHNTSQRWFVPFIRLLPWPLTLAGIGLNVKNVANLLFFSCMTRWLKDPWHAVSIHSPNAMVRETDKI